MFNPPALLAVLLYFAVSQTSRNIFFPRLKLLFYCFVYDYREVIPQFSRDIDVTMRPVTVPIAPLGTYGRI